MNVQGFDDDTPLHDASSNGHKKVRQKLFKFFSQLTQCFHFSAFLRKSAIFVLLGNLHTWFFNFIKKNPQIILFLSKKFFRGKKKLLPVTIFRKQNGS